MRWPPGPLSMHVLQVIFSLTRGFMYFAWSHYLPGRAPRFPEDKLEFIILLFWSKVPLMNKHDQFQCFFKQSGSRIRWQSSYTLTFSKLLFFVEFSHIIHISVSYNWSKALRVFTENVHEECSEVLYPGMSADLTLTPLQKFPFAFDHTLSIFSPSVDQLTVSYDIFMGTLPVLRQRWGISTCVHHAL